MNDAVKAINRLRPPPVSIDPTVRADQFPAGGPSSVRSHFSFSPSSPSPGRASHHQPRFELPPRRPSSAARAPPPFATINRRHIPAVPPMSARSIASPYRQLPNSVRSQMTVSSLGSTAMSAFGGGGGRIKEGGGGRGDKSKGPWKAAASGYYRAPAAVGDRPKWMI